MSRGYRIESQALRTATVDVKGQDSLCIDVTLLPILGAETMGSMLVAELQKDGWTATKDGGAQKTLDGGLVVTIDAAGTTVTASLTKVETVAGRGTTEDAATANARAQADAARAALQKGATRSLGQAEGAIRADLDAAIQRVYIEALGQKARSLGDVESMQQSVAADGSLEITIKIKS